MVRPLTYDTLERLSVGRPVDRLGYIAELCRGMRVLDVGCLDETAIEKQGTEDWLHGRISAVAERVIGIDSSANIPGDGLRTGPSSIIVRGDGIDPAVPQLHDMDVEKIVAGEFIEHIDEPLLFFRNLKQRFPGRELIVSTPNGTSLANVLLGVIRREAQHPDHVHIFTYKVLNTLCLRAGFRDYEIIPYHFYATEMKLRSRGLMRFCVAVVERAIRVAERFCPLLCFGYVVRVQL